MRDIEVKPREIYVSIMIVLLMIGLGFIIKNSILDKDAEKAEQFRTALKVKDKDTYDYAIETEQGNILVQSSLKSIDPVSFPELKGKFTYVEKNEENHNMHTEIYTDSKGHTHTRTYWSWDYAGSERKTAKKMSIYGHSYNINKFRMNDTQNLSMSKHLKKYKKGLLSSDFYNYVNSECRYYYKVIPEEFNSTFVGKASNKGLMPIDDKITFERKTIKETMLSVENKSKKDMIIFVIIWSLITIMLVVGYVSLDNRYLD